MSKITILGHDPSLANWGFALVDVDPISLDMTPRLIKLQRTEKSKNKQVRASADKLVRARQLRQAFVELEKDAHMNAGEVPSGSQSATASNALGIATGVLACHSKPLIEVNPTEVKKAVTGYSTASKEEMVEWATNLWPDLQWIKGKAFQSKYASQNEHMADALAIVYTAIRTEQFKQAATMFQVVNAA
jgi:Holliday junction resolvasome RuvABC endonuclease subunit